MGLEFTAVYNSLLVLVTQLCPTLCDPMNYTAPVSSVHGILKARILEWVPIPCSRGSFQPRNQSHVSIADTREALGTEITGN